MLRALIIYFVSSFFRRPATTPEATPGVGGAVGVPQSKLPAWNLFENGTLFDLHAYVSEDIGHVDFTNEKNLVWFQEGLSYGDWYGGREGDGTFTHSTTIEASEKLQRNGTIYLHVYVTKFGLSPNPGARDSYAGTEVGHTSRLLNKFKKIRYAKTHNLLTGETDKSEEEIRKSERMTSEIVSHWHPNLTINLVTDQTNWVKGAVPQPLDEYVTFDRDGKTYYPIVFLNDYWNMLRDYQPINETTKTLELTLTFQPLSLFKWQLYAAQAMKNKWTSNFLGDALGKTPF